MSVTRCLVGSLAYGLDQHSYSTLGPVSAWMGDHIWAGKLSLYITSHPGQLSLAIPLWFIYLWAQRPTKGR